MRKAYRMLAILTLLVSVFAVVKGGNEEQEEVVVYEYDYRDLQPPCMAEIEPVIPVQEEIVVTLEPAYEGHVIDAQEAYRLAQLISAENGINESDEALVLTGVVALKRVKSDIYPNSLEEVISQPGQYLCYINGTIDREPDDRSLEIAEEILCYDLADEYPDELVYQAEFKQGREVYAVYGNQFFCLR